MHRSRRSALHVVARYAARRPGNVCSLDARGRPRQLELWDGILRPGEMKMQETIDSTKQVPTKKPEQKDIREALLRLRQLATSLPLVDAVAVVRDIREGGSSTN